MKSRKIKNIGTVVAVCLTCIFSISAIGLKNEQSIETSTSSILSNKKIEWGIKRGKNHEQPDLGKENKRIVDECDGISMGNIEKKYIYLTFDCGYEAGYTEKILEVLKQNDVKATFFITGHYLNSEPELVKKMTDEGHIIGNHTPISLMSGDNIKVKC